MFTTVVALRLQLLEVRVMGFTEEIRSQLFGMGALGRRRAINELRSSEDKNARSLVPCWRMWWLAHARSADCRRSRSAS